MARLLSLAEAELGGYCGEEEGRMDEDMEEGGFEEFPVDFEYEYDAPRFFDFCRWESDGEAMVSERWFESVPSNPPSPYVVRLIERQSVLMESTHPAIVDQEGSFANGRSFYNVQAECSQISDAVKESISIKFMEKETSKLKSKDNIKTHPLRSSTLMKPTASHLAKQNQAREVNASVRMAQRFDKPLAFKAQQILEKPNVTDNQASKRQKLEGGLLCKVLHMQQQSNWAHKAPRKNVPIIGHSEFLRPNLTIPREPELVTARRARRMRHKQGTEVEHASQSTQTFKARPLNRKIFEPPPMLLRQKSTPHLPVFQEFHLKTSGRAMRHVSAASSTHLVGRTIIDQKAVQKVKTADFGQGRLFLSKGLQCPHFQSQRFQVREDETTLHNFKARSLNQKIFCTQGDMPIFVTRKPLLTTPMEMNVHNNKRLLQNLPAELFNKLSLSDNNQTSRLEMKGSKENVSDSLKQGFKAIHSSRDGLPGNGGNRILPEIRF